MALYLYLNGAPRGPFPSEQVRAYLRDGLVETDDLAASSRDGEWKPIASFPELQTEPKSEPQRAIPSPPPATVIAEAVPPLAAAPAPAIAAPPVTAVPSGSAAPLAVPALGPYARATLAPNETAHFQTSLHWIIFVRFAILGLLVFFLVAIPFAIGVQAVTGSELGWFALPLPSFLLLPPALAFASSELVITDRRVLIKTGIVRRQTMEMFIAKVESIAVDQGVLGRVLDYGTVTIRGTGGFEEPFEAISRPLLFRNWVQRLQSGQAAT